MKTRRYNGNHYHSFCNGIAEERAEMDHFLAGHREAYAYEAQAHRDGFRYEHPFGFEQEERTLNQRARKARPRKGRF